MDCSGSCGELPRSRVVSRVSAVLASFSISGHHSRAREASSPKGHTLIQVDVRLPPGHTSPAPLPAFGTSPKVHPRSGAAGGVCCGPPLQLNHRCMFSSAESCFLQSFYTPPDTLSSRASSINLLYVARSLLPRERDLCAHLGLGLSSSPHPSWLSLRIQGP